MVRQAGPTKMPISTGIADPGPLRRGNARGFTLVELMVVLTILALAATAVFLFTAKNSSHSAAQMVQTAARVAAFR